MPAELTADSSHEEIQDYVDQAVEDVEKDRAGETTDSRKIAEETDKPITERTAAETESGSDDTAGDGEESSGGQVQDWLDDGLKAEVAAYGIDEKELVDFTSRDELERALRFFDRSALDAGRKAMAEGDELKDARSARDEKGRFAKDESESEPGGKFKEGQYEVKLSRRDLYDEDLKEDLVEEFTALRDHYDSRLKALESRLLETEAMAEEERFDGLVDSLGHADLFGKTGEETPKELQRRRDLHVAVKAQQIGLQTLGREVDLDKSLVGRVARMVFADELGKKELKARTRKLSSQSDGRMGGGGTRSSAPPETLLEEARRLYKELEGA